MRKFTAILVIVAAISSIAAPGASAASRGAMGGAGKVSTQDLAMQPGGGTALTYKLTNVLISS